MTVVKKALPRSLSDAQNAATSLNPLVDILLLLVVLFFEIQKLKLNNLIFLTATLPSACKTESAAALKLPRHLKLLLTVKNSVRIEKELENLMPHVTHVSLSLTQFSVKSILSCFNFSSMRI